MTMNVPSATVTLRYENILLILRQTARGRNCNNPTARVFFWCVCGGAIFLIEIIFS